MRFLIIFFLMTSFAFAETPVNEKYSFKAFPYHGLSFKNVNVKEFNNTIIKGSCFYQEWVEGDSNVIKDIFPDGMKGVTFINCNLDNIYIPVGNTILGSSHKKIAVQNDLSDWILDNQLKPKIPMDKEQRLKAGISIDSKDIPNTKFTGKERDAFEETFNNISN